MLSHGSNSAFDDASPARGATHELSNSGFDDASDAGMYDEKVVAATVSCWNL